VAASDGPPTEESSTQGAEIGLTQAGASNNTTNDLFAASTTPKAPGCAALTPPQPGDTDEGPFRGAGTRHDGDGTNLVTYDGRKVNGMRSLVGVTVRW